MAEGVHGGSLFAGFGFGAGGMSRVLAVEVYLTLSGLNALLEHANVRVSQRLDRWLGLLMVTPSMHKIHHSRVPSQTDTNYSNIFSVWDRLCGTYTPSTSTGPHYGLEGFDSKDRQTLAALLKTPFSTFLALL